MSSTPAPPPTATTAPAPPKDAGPTELPEGSMALYSVTADKKLLPTDSVVVEVSAPLSLELQPDPNPAGGSIASGRLVALEVPAKGITVTAILTHSGGTTLKAVATVDVVLPDPATKVEISVSKALPIPDPNKPAKGTPRNPN